MLANVSHPGLRALLEFEEARSKVPIEYEEVADLGSVDLEFGPKVKVHAYGGRDKAEHELVVGEADIRYSGPYATPTGEYETRVFVGEGDVDVLAAVVVENHVLVTLSLERLFAIPAEEQDPRTAATLQRTVHAVFDAIFSNALPVALKNIREHDWSEARDSYVRMKLDTLDRSVRSWKEEIQRNERDAEEKTWQIAGLVSRNERLREALGQFEDSTRMQQKRKAVEEHGEMVKMLQAGSIFNLRFESGEVHFETGKVEIDFEDYAYVLGPFHVEMTLADASLNIKGLKGCAKVDGYSHPHVASSGVPCLGNIAPVIAKTLGMGDVVGAIGTVLEFLRAYNDGNGYVDLRRWNPDWEDDDDRFESCFENSSCHDCVVCGDEGCQYRDGAESRCWENHEIEECIECGDCSYRDRAIENCRRDHEPWECTTCPRSCTWAGDLRECHDSHDGGRCPDCPEDTCNYNPKKTSAAGDDGG
jgi:hypothetical protein